MQKVQKAIVSYPVPGCIEPSLTIMGWAHHDFGAALQSPKLQPQPRGTPVPGSEQKPDTHSSSQDQSWRWSVRTEAAIFMQGLLRQSSVIYLMCQTGVSHNQGEESHEGREQDLLHEPHNPMWASFFELPPQTQMNTKPHSAWSICAQPCPAQFSCFAAPKVLSISWQAARKSN